MYSLAKVQTLADKIQKSISHMNPTEYQERMDYLKNCTMVYVLLENKNTPKIYG